MTELQKLKKIEEYDDEMREVEDRALETWLMMGPPDGIKRDELLDYLHDEGQFEEWEVLYYKLAQYREENDEEL